MLPDKGLDLISISSESMKNFFEKYEGIVNQSELIDVIENRLHNNLIEHYRNRLISVILNDNSIYNQDEHRKCLEELKKLRKIFTFDEIKIYLLARIIPENDDKIWFLVEDVFSSHLKDFIINRENERNKRKIPYWDKKIQHEWEQLKAIMPKEDILTYALRILRDERKKKCL